MRTCTHRTEGREQQHDCIFIVGSSTRQRHSDICCTSSWPACVLGVFEALSLFLSLTHTHTILSVFELMQVPGMEEMSRFPSEEELEKAREAPWGRICDQYDWPDLEQLGPGYAPPDYKGSLRHENMSWFWIKDLTSCK